MTDLPRLGASSIYPDLRSNVERVNMLRLKQLTLGYNLPENGLKRFILVVLGCLSRVKIFGLGQIIPGRIRRWWIWILVWITERHILYRRNGRLG